MRGVNFSLSMEEIKEGISWWRYNIDIIFIEKLKFKLSDQEELCDFPTIKITFNSNLLPEFLYIWRIKSKVTLFVNKVKKCSKCARWGHSVLAYRGKFTCPRCGLSHSETDCNNTNLRCVNCGEHHSFHYSCLSLKDHRIINTTMTYGNVTKFDAKKIIKSLNITSVYQVYESCKAFAFKAWDSISLDLDDSSRCPIRYSGTCSGKTN